MQLSNFWRDIGEDWRIGRVYFPGEDLARFQVTEADDPQGRTISPTSSGCWNSRSSGPKPITGIRASACGGWRRVGWAVMAGLEVYRAILPGIRRNGYDVFTRRVGTTKPQKLGLAPRPLAVYFPWMVFS